MSPRSSSTTPPSIAGVLGQRLSTATIFFHTAVADRMGISVTEAKCRSLLVQHGPLTAGGLAQRLGLTTGAVTGVIDRLVEAGLARRETDPTDRRRVVVALVPNAPRDREIARLFGPMGTRIRALAGAYSAKDQATIARFLAQASEVLEQETDRLRETRRDTSAPTVGGSDRTAPAPSSRASRRTSPRRPS
jgi:DNA-binding MarR family transcriptional regulator